MDSAKQPKILGFLGSTQSYCAPTLEAFLRDELKHIQTILGGRMIAVTTARPGNHLIFLKTCIELRIPVLLLFTKETNSPCAFGEDWKMANMLFSMALAQYRANEDFLVDWGDALLLAGENSCNAKDLGIPHQKIQFEPFDTCWPVPLDAKRGARHGFANRFDLMEFLDSRYERAEIPKKP
jgi:hypothetical protein